MTIENVIATVPAPDILRCAYMEIQVTDLRAAREFYVDILGLTVTAEDDQHIYLRSIEAFIHHNLVLRQGPIAAMTAFSFRMRSREDVDRAEAWFRARGCRTERRKEGFTRGIGDSVRVEDPLGFPHEFFHDVQNVERLTWRYDLHTPGALRKSDLIERGPGRHGVSNAFYLYLRDPDGHRIEIYTQDYYTDDPDNPVMSWDVDDNQRRDWWGNPVAASWYTEGSLVLDLDGNPQPVTERSEPSEMAVTIGADGFSYTRKDDVLEGFRLGNSL
ncbi:VOC family protein [Klebsiella grimontii]|uniref:VOC family protein n=1 Tax=Klebsiella grimontii TaxID=2058152 RepID=UPI003D80A0EB